MMTSRGVNWMANLAAVAIALVWCAMPTAAQCVETDLTADDGKNNNAFGAVVDISNEIMVIGATQDDEAGELAGAAYVFILQDGQWVQQQKLLPDTVDPGDQFGQAVAIENGLIIVGSPDEQADDAQSGAAYIFRLTDGVWVEEARIVRPKPQDSDDRFGESVAVTEDSVVIGSPGTDFVFFYDYFEATEEWGLVQFFQGTDFLPIPGTFGGAVDVNGTTAVIADPTREIAFIFERNEKSAEWEFQIDIEEDESATPSQYGSSIAIDGDVIAIGAPSEDLLTNNGGAVYMYRRVKGDWMFEQKLNASDQGTFFGFGGGLGLSCNAVLTGGGENAYLFNFDGKQWNETDILAGPFGGTLSGDELIGLSGDIGIVGTAGFFNLEGQVTVFRGMSINDCNDNDIADACEILDNPSLDDNGDGLIDTCTPPADLDDSGTVSGGDLLILLNAWGECEDTCNCPEDLNGSGNVSGNDLLILLNLWGTRF